MTDENIDKEELARWEEKSKLDLERLRQDVDDRDIDYGALPNNNDNFFSFFREILHTKDSKKVAFLSTGELGALKYSVRRYLDLSLFVHSAYGMAKVSTYLAAKAEIVAATSMSKKGSFLKTMVTKIRMTASGDQKTPEQKKWWQKKSKDSIGDEDGQ